MNTSQARKKRLLNKITTSNTKTRKLRSRRHQSFTPNTTTIVVKSKTPTDVQTQEKYQQLNKNPLQSQKNDHTQLYAKKQQPNKHKQSPNQPSRVSRSHAKNTNENDCKIAHNSWKKTRKKVQKSTASMHAKILTNTAKITTPKFYQRNQNQETNGQTQPEFFANTNSCQEKNRCQNQLRVLLANHNPGIWYFDQWKCLTLWRHMPSSIPIGTRVHTI